MKGDVPEATQMVMDLRENYHIFCSIVVYPVIPKGDIIYRIIPTAAHSDEDIERTLKAFEETKRNSMPAPIKRLKYQIWQNRSSRFQSVYMKKGPQALFSCTLIREVQTDNIGRQSIASKIMAVTEFHGRQVPNAQHPPFHGVYRNPPPKNDC